MSSSRLMSLLGLVLVVAISQVSAEGGAAGATRLIHDLNKDYEKLVYPDNITLQVGLTYVCAYMDEEHHRLNSRVVERYHWVDHRLTWDPTKYAGVDKVSIPDKYIWTPDVHLQNAIFSENRDSVNAVILSNGNVYWIPPVNYKTRCTENHDDHDDHDDHHDDHDDDDDDHDDHSYHCKLSLGSWTYDANLIPLELFASGFDTKMYVDSCPYVIDNAKAVIKNTKYDCCPNPYATLNVEFDLHKRHDDDDDDDDEEEEDEENLHWSEDCPWPKKKCAKHDDDD